MLSIFDDLRQQILNNGKQLDLGQIQRAYETAEKAHGGQLRVSGEPYIIHPLNVASIAGRRRYQAGKNPVFFSGRTAGGKYP